MRKMRRTIAFQPDSASRQARYAGLRHDETSRVEVTLGVTPSETIESGGRLIPHPQAAHFCPSEFRVIQRHALGDGMELPDYDEILLSRLPDIWVPSIVRFETTAHLNGRFRLSKVNNVRAVAVPESMNELTPWAREGGAQDVAADYGCDSVDEMFAVYGQPV